MSHFLHLNDPDVEHHFFARGQDPHLSVPGQHSSLSIYTYASGISHPEANEYHPTMSGIKSDYAFGYRDSSYVEGSHSPAFSMGDSFDKGF